MTKQLRTKLLGMPLDTADRKLRRLVILSLLQRLGEDGCEVCRQRITSSEDLAMRHREDWLEDSEMFWDIQNIIFTHTHCTPKRTAMSLHQHDIHVTFNSNLKSLQTIDHRGILYLVAEPGASYTIRIHNRSSRRICAVVTVDGRNVITGKSGSVNDSGYIINAYSSVDIDGWRESDTTTAKLKFCGVEDAYATQMSGSSENVGVIGFAFFEEYQEPYRIPISPQGRSKRIMLNNDSGGVYSTVGLERGVTRSAVVPQSVGTGFGESQYSPSRRVEFKRSETPLIISYRYDTAEALRAQGVPIGDVGGPSPFPADAGFAKTPPRRV